MNSYPPRDPRRWDDPRSPDEIKADLRMLLAYDPASSSASTVLSLGGAVRNFGGPGILFVVDDPEPPRDPAAFTIPLSVESYRKLDAMIKPVSIERIKLAEEAQSLVRVPPRAGKLRAYGSDERSDRRPAPPRRAKPSGESKLARRMRRAR